MSVRLQLPVSLLALLALACGRGEPQLPFYTSAELTAQWPATDGAEVSERHRIAPFDLTDQTGAHVTNQTLRGHVYLANFFFTTCQAVCPKMVKNLGTVQAAFADDPRVRLVSHSVDPDEDSAAVLARYGGENGVRPGKWHLLTGERQAIYTLARTSYFAEKSLGLKKGTNDFLHTENMLLVDGAGRLRGVYNATLALDAERAIGDIRVLLRGM